MGFMKANCINSLLNHFTTRVNTVPTAFPREKKCDHIMQLQEGSNPIQMLPR